MKMKSRGIDSSTACRLLFAASFVTFLGDALRKVMAISLPTLKEQFESETWLIGAIIASMHAARDFFAPIVGSVVNQSNSRTISIIGGTIGSLSVLIASFAINARMLFVFISLINGASFAMLTIPAYTLMAHSFDKYYALANGTVQATGAVSLIVAAPLTQILLDAYGWQNTFLVISAIYSHLIVCGILLKPSSVPKHSDGHTSSVHISLISSNKTKMTKTFTDQSEQGTASKILNLLLLFAKKSGVANFRNISFVAICIAHGCSLAIYTGWVIYLVPHCIVKGLSPKDASSLASITGVAFLIGCVGNIHILLENVLSIRSFIYVCCFLGSISLILDTFSCSFITILLSNACFGFSIGACLPLIDVLLKSTVPPDMLSKAFGWRFAICGVFRIIAGVSIGWFYDKSGSYNAGFYFMGVLNAVCGAVLAADQLRIYYFNYRLKK